MRKNLPLVVIFAVVIVGFGYFTLFTTPISNMSQQANEKPGEFVLVEDELMVEKEETINDKGTLEDLRLMNKDLECTVFFDLDGTERRGQGTYFVSEGSMRVDFLSESPDLSSQILSSVIIEDGIVYSWSVIEGQFYGVKMQLDVVQNNTRQNNLPVSINQEVDYECKTWAEVDSAVFTPPSNVLFSDLGDLMETGMEYGTIYNEE